METNNKKTKKFAPLHLNVNYPTPFFLISSRFNILKNMGSIMADATFIDMDVIP